VGIRSSTPQAGMTLVHLASPVCGEEKNQE